MVSDTQKQGQHILLPVDDSATTKNTIKHLITGCSVSRKAKLTLIHVVNNDQLAYRMIPDFQMEMVKENAKKMAALLLDNTTSILEKDGYACEKILLSGEPRVELARYANEGRYDLVIIGRHAGGGPLRNVIFGSVATYMLHNVKCAVLLL